MKMLLEHVDAFFKDIISETQEREKAIRERIDSRSSSVASSGRSLKSTSFQV